MIAALGSRGTSAVLIFSVGWQAETASAETATLATAQRRGSARDLDKPPEIRITLSEYVLTPGLTQAHPATTRRRNLKRVRQKAGEQGSAGEFTAVVLEEPADDADYQDPQAQHDEPDREDQAQGDAGST